MSTKITTPELVVQVKDNFDAVYEAGYEKGKTMGIDYDTFWDAFQSKGSAMTYYYACAYNRFTNTTFKPKYAFVGSSNAVGLQNVFYNSSALVEIPVDIDATGSPHIGGLFIGCSGLKKIKKLRIDGTTVNGGGNAFSKCSALTSIEIDGTIVMDWNMDVCPLDDKSIKSVVGALSDNVTNKTCTFNKAAVNAAFTAEEWDALTATKPKWNFTLYEETKGG